MNRLKTWLNSRIGRLIMHDAATSIGAAVVAFEASGQQVTWAAATLVGTAAFRNFMRLLLPIPAAEPKHGMDAAAIRAAVGARQAHRVRTAGHRGRLPVKAPADRFPIDWLHTYLRTPLPAPTYPIDVTGGITTWGMLGNGPDPTCTTHPNGVGNCTFAGRQHAKIAKAAAAGLTETWETSNALVAEYLAYDHGKDQGAVIADLLLAWYKAGVIEAFAPVDHTYPAAVDAAMDAFHGCYVGVSLTDDADQLFEQGQPWTTSSGQKPDPDDGHCIVKVKATGKQDAWVTWGGLQPSTLAWTKACLDEAWVIITSEDAHLVDLAALKADIDALGGTGGSTAPTPTPVPQTDSVVIIDSAVVAHINELAAKGKTTPQAYVTARLRSLWKVS